MRRAALLALLALGACAPEVHVTPVVAPFSFSVGPSCDGRFGLVNRSSRPVRAAFARPGPAAPEEELLRGAPLPPGSSLLLRAAPGVNDLRVLYADGAQAAVERLDLCGVDAVAVTDSGLRPE